MSQRHPTDVYFEKHGRYPSISIDSGAQRLTVEFHRGYVVIRTSPPFSGTVYITRSSWFKLLPKVVPLTRWYAKHPAKDWDVPARVHTAAVHEVQLLKEKRQAKKARVWDSEAAERQRRRFLKARARAAKRRARG